MFFMMCLNPYIIKINDGMTFFPWGGKKRSKHMWLLAFTNCLRNLSMYLLMMCYSIGFSTVSTYLWNYHFCPIDVANDVARTAGLQKKKKKGDKTRCWHTQVNIFSVEKNIKIKGNYMEFVQR